tara:strand:- start:21 stop:1328 length:1308 start_codon:yes stop_codon:yes gene_type:complete
MKYKEYPKYKDSGVAWIGDIPEHWKPSRIFQKFHFQKNHIIPDKMKNETVFLYSIPYVQEFGTGEIVKGDSIDSNKFEISGKEILISKLNPRKSTIVITKENKFRIVCSTEFIPLVPLDIDLKYGFYLLSSYPIKEFLSSHVNSATKSHQRISPEILMHMKYFFPEKPEQEQIGIFLNKKTTQFDQLIAKSKAQIILLEEKKQATITQAVTKGLDPSVPMKDSGVEWIGNIPEHWKIEPLKFHVKINERNLNDNFNDESEIAYIDIGSVHYGGKIDEPEIIQFSDAPSRARRIIQKNDTILSTVRTYLKAIAFVDEENDGKICSTGFAVISPKKSITPKFLYYLLSSQSYIDHVMANSVGVGYPAINSSALGRFPIIIPFNEDKEIIGFLDKKIGQIDYLISKIQKQITLLEEKKGALITAAVTGKIDVRDSVAA